MAAHPIGSRAKLREGEGYVVTVAGHAIAVFLVAGKLYALDNICSHADAALGEGSVDSDELCVECPLHGSIFSLTTGKALTLPAYKSVKTYPVWAEEDVLFVEYPA